MSGIDPNLNPPTGAAPPAFAPHQVAPAAAFVAPPKRNGGAVLLFVGLGVLFLVLTLVVLGWAAFFFTKGFTKADRERRAQNANPASVALSESFASQNGLIRAHYPADFAAKLVGDNAIVVSRMVAFTEESITLISIKNPISDDANELSRIMEMATQKEMEAKGGTYVAGEPGATHCATSASSRSGVQRVSSYKLLGQDYRLWTCTFVAGAHGYRLGYLGTQSNLTTDRPLLKRIVEATELTQ